MALLTAFQCTMVLTARSFHEIGQGAACTWYPPPLPKSCPPLAQLMSTKATPTCSAVPQHMHGLLKCQFDIQ